MHVTAAHRTTCHVVFESYSHDSVARTNFPISVSVMEIGDVPWSPVEADDDMDMDDVMSQMDGDILLPTPPYGPAAARTPRISLSTPWPSSPESSEQRSKLVFDDSITSTLSGSASATTRVCLEGFFADAACHCAPLDVSPRWS